MFLFGTIFINKEIKCYILKVGGLNDTFYINKRTNVAFHSIPNYEGQMNISEFLDWVKAVENFFDYMEILEERQAKMDACKLRGRTSVWWDRIQATRKRHGDVDINSW